MTKLIFFPICIKLKMSLVNKNVLSFFVPQICACYRDNKLVHKEPFFFVHVFQSTQGGRGTKKEMHAMWVSLKDNVKCGNKLNDVIKQQTKCGKGSGYVAEKEKMNGYNRPLMETPTTSLVVSRPSNTLGRLHGKLLSCMLLLFV